MLKEIAHTPGVAKGIVGTLLGDEVPYQLLGALGQHIAALLALHLEYSYHLLRSIILKHQKAVKARLQAGVRVDEPVHQLRVARHDDHQIVPVILHSL